MDPSLLLFILRAHNCSWKNNESKEFRRVSTIICTGVIIIYYSFSFYTKYHYIIICIIIKVTYYFNLLKLVTFFNKIIKHSKIEIIYLVCCFFYAFKFKKV